MNNNKQFFLPIDELEKICEIKLQHESDIETVSIKISSFSEHKAIRDSKDASAKIREYLDCYKIFK